MKRTVNVETLARRYLKAKASAKASEKAADKVKGDLVATMRAEGRATVEVPGLGGVVYMAAYERKDVDTAAAEALIKHLVTRLAAHGEEVEAVLPRKGVPIAPSVSISQPPKPDVPKAAE